MHIPVYLRAAVCYAHRLSAKLHGCLLLGCQAAPKCLLAVASVFLKQTAKIVMIVQLNSAALGQAVVE